MSTACGARLRRTITPPASVVVRVEVRTGANGGPLLGPIRYSASRWVSRDNAPESASRVHPEGLVKVAVFVAIFCVQPTTASSPGLTTAAAVLGVSVVPATAVAVPLVSRTLADATPDHSLRCA